MHHRSTAGAPVLAITVAAALLAACGTVPTAGPSQPGGEAVEERESPPAPDTRPVVVAFGDSLTAGQRVGRDETYPAFLQRELDSRGKSFRVVNQGVSGDTTAVALSRVEAAIASQSRPRAGPGSFGWKHVAWRRIRAEGSGSQAP